MSQKQDHKQKDQVDSGLQQSNDGVSSEDLKEVVQIILKDPVAVGRWPEIYDQLGLDDAQKENLRIQYQMGILQAPQLIQKIIQEWTSTSTATIEGLVRHLRAIRLIAVAQRIESTFLQGNR